jgi:superfamily II DNA or RNA helicase
MNYSKICGLKFVSKDGIQAELINNITESKKSSKIFKIINESRRHCFTIVEDENKALELIANNNALHEIIFTYPRRVYFDIDVKKGEQFNIFNFLQSVRVHISIDEANVYGYQLEDKQSYHITLSNTYFMNDDERLKFKEYIKYLKSMYPLEFGTIGASDSILDSRVYSVRQAFKCIHQSKPGGTPQTFIKSCNIRDIRNTFISCFIGDEKLPLFGNCGNKEAYNNFNSVGNIPKATIAKKIMDKDIVETFSLPVISYEDFDNAKKLLNMCPVNGKNGADLGHGHRYKVLLFCYWNGLKFEDYEEWFINKCLTDSIDSETIDRRVNKLKYSWQKIAPTSDNYKISIDSFKRYLTIFYPELEDTHNIGTNLFINSFEIIGKSENIDNYLNINHFERDDKYIIASLCMGGGKTTATLDYLSKNDKKSFIWLAPRQTLVLNTSERMKNEFNINHIHHLMVGNNKKKLKNAEHLLICNQSLIYIDDNKKYDIVVIDEIETVLNSWADDETHGERLENNFKTFCGLLQKADKVILLDAFITTKTYDFIKSIDTLKSITYTSDKKPTHKTFIQYDNYEDIIKAISKSITNSNKPYIYYSYKTGKKDRDGILDLDYRIKKESKDILLKNASGKDEQLEIATKDTKTFYNSLVYFAESEEKNNLGNVNEKWKDADFVITNTSITVGVNYEGLDFDDIYLFVSGTTGNPRDIIQTSMRIRKTKKQNIHIFFFDTITKNFIKYPKYYYECNNTIYKNLINNVYNEYHCDFIDSFKKFCDLTNYTYDKCQILENREKVKKQNYINDVFDSGMLIEYSKIPVIDEEQKELYENKKYERKATLIERLAVDKYYFDNHFDVLKTASRKTLWNTKGRTFIHNYDDSLIKLFVADNKVATLEEINLDQMTISDNVIELIKTRFSSTMNAKDKKRLIIKTINSILGINALENRRNSNGKSSGYVFSDLFNTLCIIKNEYFNAINDKIQEKNNNIQFIDNCDDCDEVDIDTQYNEYLQLVKQLKPIPDLYKKFELSI